MRAARWAVEYRYKFRSDVVIDLIGYRRHGHSEVDDPTTTQPGALPRALPPCRRCGNPTLAAIKLTPAPRAAEIRTEFETALKSRAQYPQNPRLAICPPIGTLFRAARYDPSFEVDTGLAADEIKAIGELMVRVPSGFSVHPKVKKLLDQRAQMSQGKLPSTSARRSCLPYGSLLAHRHARAPDRPGLPPRHIQSTPCDAD